MSYTDESANSWWIGQPQFWIASVLALTWPYRWIFKNNTTKTVFIVKKKIYVTKQVATGSRIEVKRNKVNVTGMEMRLSDMQALQTNKSYQDKKSPSVQEQ